MTFDSITAYLEIATILYYAYSNPEVQVWGLELFCKHLKYKVVDWGSFQTSAVQGSYRLGVGQMFEVQ